MATDLEGLCSGNRVGRDQQDTGAPLCAASIDKRRRDARRLQSHYELEHPGDPDPLQMLSADNVENACAWDYPAARVVSSDAAKCKDGTALGSIDSIAKSAMFLIRQHFFRETGAGVPLPQEAQLQLQQLERLSREHADKRNADKPAPPPLARFQLWGSLLHDDILAWIQDHDSFHDTLALDCMGVLTIFGLPSRSGAMRDFRWGQEVTMLEGGDVQFEIGSPAAGAAKNDTYAKFLLSDLTAIGQTELLRPDLVASALKTLYEASDKTGYVFSRTANGKSRFGDARLRDAFREQELSIGELRRRIETDANSLGREGKLSAPDRERITYILQHTVVAADKDYVHDAEDVAAADSDSDSEEDTGTRAEPSAMDWSNATDQTLCQFAARIRALEEAAAAESDSDEELRRWWRRIRALEEAAAGAAAAPVPVADGTMMMSLLRAAAACDEQDAKRRRTQ